jgi:hypothetical protein
VKAFALTHVSAARGMAGEDEETEEEAEATETGEDTGKANG